MPQPLRESIPVDITRDAMSLRPECAVRVATVTTRWTLVEVQLGLLLGCIADAPSESAVAMFLALTSTPAKRGALDAAAEATNNNQIRTILRDVMKDVKAVGKKRNDIVHGVWGVSEKYPSDLVLCETKAFVTHYAHQRRTFRWGAKDADDLYSEPIEYKRWTPQCFKNVIAREDELILKLRHFLLAFDRPLPVTPSAGQPPEDAPPQQS